MDSSTLQWVSKSSNWGLHNVTSGLVPALVRWLTNVGADPWFKTTRLCWKIISSRASPLVLVSLHPHSVLWAIGVHEEKNWGVAAIRYPQ